MKQSSIFFFLVPLIAFCSCSTNKQSKTQTQEETTSEVPDMHTSEIALDWNGVYTGVLPCADCEGIKTRVVLRRDGNFERSLIYLGKYDGAFHEEGRFEWDESGNRVILISEKGNQLYQVGENVLFHLDQDGNRISGDLAARYRLNKNRVDPTLEDRKWILIELRGQTITIKENERGGYIEFTMETGRFSGNNTCNNFFGQYELKEGNRISLGQAASTLMACPDNELETLFNEVLRMADNYSVAEGILSLNKARMAPLARFRLSE